MPRLKTALLIAPLLASIGIPALAQGTTPNPSEVLAKVSETYTKLKSYRFEGITTVQMSGGPVKQKAEFPTLLAAVRPDKVRSEVKSPVFSTLFLCDGETSWTYFAPLKQYTKRAAAPVKERPSSGRQGNESDPLSTLAASYSNPVSDYESLGSRAAGARVLREETIDLGGKPTPCYVLEVKQGSLIKSKEVELGPWTLWIDKATNLVLRDTQASIVSSLPGGNGPLQINVTKAITALSVNESVPDSLFKFTPPDGATEVDSFKIPSAGTAPKETEVNLAGKEAIDFTLKDLAMADTSLNSLRGKVVLLDFWATWCGPCRAELPTIEKIHQELKGKGLVVLGVNDEDSETILKFIKKAGYTFPTLVDSTGETGRKYAVTAIPTVVVIGKDGKVVAHFVGARSERELRAALEEAGIK